MSKEVGEMVRRESERLTDASSVHGLDRGVGPFPRRRECPCHADGYFATFKKRRESDWSSRPGSVSCRHFEQLVDELNLSP